MNYKKGDILKGYFLITEFISSGQSLWAVAEKEGKSYSIKQFTYPAYPSDSDNFTDAEKRKLLITANRFESRQRRIISLLEDDVIEQDLFRLGARYFKAQPKIDTSDDFGSLTSNEYSMLLRTLAYSVRMLHSRGIVHGNVNPKNIIFRRTSTGKITVKLIDFDNSFIEGDPLEPKEFDIDLNYASPEMGKFISSERFVDSKPNQKSDIFSLGLVFFYIFTKQLPLFDIRNFSYPFQAVLVGEKLEASSLLIPSPLQGLINKMLLNDVDSRPEINEVLHILATISSNVQSDEYSALKGTAIESYNSHYPNTESRLPGDPTVDAPPPGKKKKKHKRS